MTQATLTRVNEILEKSNKEIGSVQANAIKDFAAQRAIAATISKDEIDFETRSQEAVRHDTEAAAMKLQRSTTQQEIIDAAALSEAATQHALAESDKINGSLVQTS